MRICVAVGFNVLNICPSYLLVGSEMRPDPVNCLVRSTLKGGNSCLRIYVNKAVPLSLNFTVRVLGSFPAISMLFGIPTYSIGTDTLSSCT